MAYALCFKSHKRQCLDPVYTYCTSSIHNCILCLVNNIVTTAFHSETADKKHNFQVPRVIFSVQIILQQCLSHHTPNISLRKPHHQQPTLLPIPSRPGSKALNMLICRVYFGAISNCLIIIIIIVGSAAERCS